MESTVSLPNAGASLSSVVDKADTTWSPGVRALFWCIGVLIFGALADFVAIALVFFKGKTSGMHYEILKPGIIGGFILCVTGAVLMDMLAFYKKFLPITALVVMTIFVFCLIPVAACKCNADIDQDLLLIVFYFTLAISIFITWLTKMHLFKAEEYLTRAK